MLFSKENKPTEEGFYWVINGNGDPYIKKVKQSSFTEELMIEGRGTVKNEKFLYWGSKIESPKEVEFADRYLEEDDIKTHEISE